MNKLSSFDMALGSLALALTRRCGAFIVAALAAVVNLGVVSRVLGASASDVQAAGGASDSITLKVARSIKPQLNYGDLAASLLLNKNTSDDRKVFLFLPEPGGLARGILFPTSATNTTVITGGSVVLVGTIVRDDPTKESTTHTFTPEGSLSGEAQEMANRVAALVGPSLAGEVLTPAKSRSVVALINAICDDFAKIRLDEDEEEVPAITEKFALVFDQTSDGNLKLYKGAEVGTLTGKLADVEQVATEPDELTSLW